MHAQIGTPEPGRYKAVVSSDDKQYGGQGRIDNATEHFTHPEGTPGKRHALEARHAQTSPLLWCKTLQRFICMREARTHDRTEYAGMRETNFNDRAFSMKVYAPSRTVGIYARMPE